MLLGFWLCLCGLGVVVGMEWGGLVFVGLCWLYGCGVFVGIYKIGVGFLVVFLWVGLFFGWIAVVLLLIGVFS